MTDRETFTAPAASGRCNVQVLAAGDGGPTTPLLPPPSRPMPIQLICPNLRCRKVLAVPEEVRGRIVKCQHCTTMLRVPKPKPADPMACRGSRPPGRRSRRS